MPHHRGCARAVLGTLLLAAAACGNTGNGDLSGVPQGRPTPSPVGKLTGRSSALVIDTAGGTVPSPDARLAVVVLAGTVAAPIDITIQEITNTAPGGVGISYRIGPEGTQFTSPVTLTFHPDLTAHALADLTIATQDGQGFWLRPKDVFRDAVAGTLSVTTTHFSDWAVVTGTTARDFRGTFTLQSSLDLPFTATGTATLNLAGQDTAGLYFLQWGTITLSSATSAGATCVPDAPALPLFTNIAELKPNPNPTRFDWGFSGHWNLTCTGAGGVVSSQFLGTAFDTLGVNDIGCTRTYVGTPTVTTDHLAGTMLVDCGAKGSSIATWDFQTCTPGVVCQPSNVCQTGAISCTTGVPVCAPTGSVADGTSCGTNLVCSAGTCVSCTAGLTCTPTNACHTGTTSCSTGSSVCTDTGTNVANGTSCGTNLVCSAGACVSCTAGLACTPTNPCDVGTTSCSTGTSTCTDTLVPVTNGISCGTNLVCSAGACVACTAGLACTPTNACHTGTTSCSTGTSTCTDTGTNASPGTICGTNLVCDGAGVCVSCTAGLACTPTNPCDVGTSSCSTGASVCTDTLVPGANGTSCGTNLVCSAGACVSCAAGLACTPTNACHTGTTSCGTGLPVCNDSGTNVTPGTSCGTNQVCDAAGTCNACTAGDPCTSADPCHTAGIVCTSGTPVCTDNGNQADGTTCGTNQFCGGGVCNACTEGAACQPAANPCTLGTNSCTTGVPVCSQDTPIGFQAPGTSCGANQVCDASAACVGCTQGGDCVPPGDECHVGVQDCTAGPVCTATAVERPPGTTCPTGTCTVGGVCGP